MQKIIVAGMAMVATATAEARIVCRDGYQVVQGREISTPCCNDHYVAKLARKRGIKVSDKEIRNNLARKNSVCDVIGHDIEARQYCPDIDDLRGK